MAEFVYDGAGNSEVQQREALAHLLTPAGTLARTGVADGLLVWQTATASGSVIITVGAGVVQSAVLDGAHLLVCDTTRTLDIFTANPVGGLPRNDIVVFDAVTATIAVIVGTPNVTPVDPTVPTSALPLARLRQAASATTIPAAAIDDLRVWVGLRGTPIPVATTAALAALVPYDGMQAYMLDTHVGVAYQNGAWVTKATVTDTGWITAGFTPASGFTITSQVARRLNGVVSVQLNMVSISAIAAGNIANVDVANIPAGWEPAQSNGHLGGGPSGGGHTSYVSVTANTITMTATDTGFGAGDGFYVLGMWML